MNKKRIAVLVVVLVAFCSAASAGEVYGKIRDGTSPVGDAASVEATCGSKKYPEVKTDKSGSYRLVLAETGKCTMTVKYKQQSGSLDIASYDDAVQIDIALELKDGKLSVRRK